MLQKVCTASLWVCDGGMIEHFDGSVNDYKKRRIMAQANEAGGGTGQLICSLESSRSYKARRPLTIIGFVASDGRAERDDVGWS